MHRLKFVFPPSPTASVAVAGGGSFPVRRIFCIGRNYADHVAEMGGDPKSDPPVFFMKPPDAIVASGASIPYPQSTSNLHFEGELVVALKSGGRDIGSADAAAAVIFGYACGCDLTRRDLQAAAKKSGGPWDASKGFDCSAPVGAILPAPGALISRLKGERLRLSVNSETKQDAPLSSMIWSVPDVIIELSRLFELKAGDLIFTGTPQGVGPLLPGDRATVSIGPLPPLNFAIGARS